MSKIFALATLTALLLATPLAARADTPPASTLFITTTALIQVKTGSGTLIAVVANGIQTQPATCYDNAAGTATNAITPSQTLGAIGGLLGLPAGGVRFNAGLVCQVPTAIVTSVVVYFL